MQDKSKKSHTSTNFYLVVVILIIAICMSVRYIVRKHRVLQEMIAKNHLPDSAFLDLLEKAKRFFAPVDRVLRPFAPAIEFLFAIVLIELGGQFIAIFLPKKTKVIMRGITNKVSQKVEDWIKKSLQRLKNPRK